MKIPRSVRVGCVVWLCITSLLAGCAGTTSSGGGSTTVSGSFGGTTTTGTQSGGGSIAFTNQQGPSP